MAARVLGALSLVRERNAHAHAQDVRVQMRPGPAKRRFTEDEIRAIRGSGLSAAEEAKQRGCSIRTIVNIRCGFNYAWVT